MTLNQISLFISTGVEPLYDISGNTKILKVDASGNLLKPITDINNQINSVIASLPSGATYLNHTMVTYTLSAPPVMLLTVFYTT